MYEMIYEPFCSMYARAHTHTHILINSLIWWFCLPVSHSLLHDNFWYDMLKRVYNAYIPFFAECIAITMISFAHSVSAQWRGHWRTHSFPWSRDFCCPCKGKVYAECVLNPHVIFAVNCFLSAHVWSLLKQPDAQCVLSYGVLIQLIHDIYSSIRTMCGMCSRAVALFWYSLLVTMCSRVWRCSGTTYSWQCVIGQGAGVVQLNSWQCVVGHGFFLAQPNRDNVL